MKRLKLILSIFAIAALSLTFIFISCKKEEIETEMSINQTETGQLDIGETATAIVTITTEGVKSFKYYKVVDNVKGSAQDAASALVQNGNTYTYNFSYQIQEFDDLATLGFEFELTDNKNLVKTVALAVNVNISVQSMFVKYDWKVIESEWLGFDVLADHDAAYIYRFDQDGTYEIDMTPTYAGDTHHFCFWVYKETPNNADTIAIMRLVRKLKSGDIGVDEYYDYRITSANESQMTMFWDVAAFGLYNIQNTFKSQAKGAFQPYGTVEMEAIVNANTALSCSTIDEDLLTIP